MSVAVRRPSGDSSVARIFAPFEPIAPMPAARANDRLAERTAARRPEREHPRADQVATRHRSPDAGVAGVDPAVTEYEVVARRNSGPPVGFVTSQRRIDVRLHETVAIDVDGAAALRHQLAGKPDDALDEGRTPVTQPTSLSCLGSSEDNDLSPLGSPSLYAIRLAITRSLNRPWQNSVGFAQ